MARPVRHDWNTSEEDRLSEGLHQVFDGVLREEIPSDLLALGRLIERGGRAKPGEPRRPGNT